MLVSTFCTTSSCDFVSGQNLDVIKISLRDTTVEFLITFPIRSSLPYILAVSMCLYPAAQDRNQAEAEESGF